MLGHEAGQSTLLFRQPLQHAYAPLLRRYHFQDPQEMVEVIQRLTTPEGILNYGTQVSRGSPKSAVDRAFLDP